MPDHTERERFDSYLCVGGPSDGQTVALPFGVWSVEWTRLNPHTLLPEPWGTYEVGILGNRGKLIWTEAPNAE